MIRQGTVAASNRRGLETYLLAQHLNGRLDSADSLQTVAWVHLDVILFAYEALRKLETFAFVALYLFSARGRHTSAVVDLICLIERL